MGNITHEFVSAIPDGDDESLVRPSDWNAEHEVSAPVADHDVATKQYVDEAGEVITDSAVLKVSFDAHTILRAIDDNSPITLTVSEQTLVGRITGGVITALTGAQVMVLLSGQAGASFDFNSQNLTSAGTINTHTIPGGTDTFCLLATSQELTNKTLTASVVSGTWTASGAWTIPAVTLNGTVTGGNNDLSHIGHIGLANNAAHTNYAIYSLEEAVAEIGGNSSLGSIVGYRDAYKTSAAYTGALTGLEIEVNILSKNTQNWTHVVGLRGVFSQVGLITGTASPSTITGAANFYARALTMGGAANDMVLTNYYGLYIEARSLVGNSKLTNDYGIYIGAQAGGATLNYAIYTAGGSVYHVGDLTAANIITAGNVDGVDVSGVPARSLMFALCS